ncbi:hypothetical protein KSP39_PZI004681 [Platanthera zijinensis]|uniref:Rho termination factor-like N-terminal domain-containing protein n=1 Tax=Platanthera zijinensis TaxID=2320716 RepID=A0AAP0BXD8_9ASPA
MIRHCVLPVACGNCSYVVSDWNQGAVGRTALSFSSSSRRHKHFFDVNLSLSLSISSYPTITSLCKARPSKRNPDFSRKYRGSSSKNRRQNQERENSENLEDSSFPSKNGPLVSLSNNQRYSATAAPGRREKEIVELFRKVQSQLRERAAIKEEKRVESAQQGPGERGTVDSLLKLLRKHSVSQGKKTAAGDVDDGYDLDQPERTNPFDEPETSDLFEDEQHSSFLVSENLGTSQNGVRNSKPVPFTRPTSSFRRKSPVPKVKFQPVFSAEEEGGGDSTVNSQNKATGLSSEHDLAPEPPACHLLESEDDELITKLGYLDGDIELSADPIESSDSEETDPGIPGTSMIQSTGLSTMKVSELRGLAKSKGIKGYSKLKKIELLELLTLNSS